MIEIVFLAVILFGVVCVIGAGIRAIGELFAGPGTPGEPDVTADDADENEEAQR